MPGGQAHWFAFSSVLKKLALCTRLCSFRCKSVFTGAVEARLNFLRGFACAVLDKHNQLLKGPELQILSLTFVCSDHHLPGGRVTATHPTVLIAVMPCIFVQLPPGCIFEDIVGGRLNTDREDVLV